MAEQHINIRDEHKRHLTRLEGILEFLNAERLRLTVEMSALERQGAVVHNELVALLQRHYGVDAQHAPFTLDTERGAIIVPLAEPAPGPSDEASAPADPGLPAPQDSAAAEQAHEG